MSLNFFRKENTDKMEIIKNKLSLEYNLTKIIPNKLGTPNFVPYESKYEFHQKFKKSSTNFG